MSRYIDADKIQFFIGIDAETGEEIMLATMNQIEELPTAEVVEVVRCGECIHRNSGRMYCQGRHPDWYCPKGERREQNEG